MDERGAGVIYRWGRKGGKKSVIVHVLHEGFLKVGHDITLVGILPGTTRWPLFMGRGAGTSNCEFNQNKTDHTNCSWLNNVKGPTSLVDDYQKGC